MLYGTTGTSERKRDVQLTLLTAPLQVVGHAWLRFALHVMASVVSVFTRSAS